MRLTPDQFVGSCLAATLAKDDSPLVAVGFVRDAEGNLSCETVLAHDPFQGDDARRSATISDPAQLAYTLVIDGTTRIPMTHRCVPLGMGSIVSRLTADSVPLPADTAHVRLDVTRVNGKPLTTVFQGSFSVPTRVHPLGHPNGPEGYMVQVFSKNFLFVQPALGRVTFQANLCEYDEST